MCVFTLDVVRDWFTSQAGGTPKHLRICMFTLVLVTILGFSSCFQCENTVISQLDAPGGNLKAVVFERSCGATTDFATQVSIINQSEEIGVEAGNILSIDSDHGRTPVTANG